MQRPKPETVTLKDILITEELSQRTPRPSNLQAENQAMRSLARQMARDSQSLMQSLADTALELCQAGTAGVSLLETTPDGEEIFRWNVLAGTLAHYVGGTTPHNFSPCGFCLNQGTPVLFSHPESYFTYFQEANTPVVEGLVFPLVADDHPLGTIWIMSHDEQRQFDSEDVRIMTSLADFTVAALLLNQHQTRELLAVNAILETSVEEHRQAEAQLQALIANLPGGAVFVVDRNLRYLLAEGEALAIAGFKPEDLVGKTIFEVLPPDLAARYEPMYRQALVGEPFEHEHHAHNRSYVSRGTPLRSVNGEVYAVLVVSYDISDRMRVEDERKVAEVALHESEEKYQSLFNSMDEAYAVVEVLADDNGEWNDFLFLEVNPAFVAQTGMEYPVGRKATELLGTPNPQWAKVYGRVAATGEPIRFEEGEATLGRVFDLYVFRLGGDGSRRVAVLFTDITQRKRREANLAFLADLMNDFAPLATAEEIMEMAGKRIAEHLNLSRYLFVEINPEAGECTYLLPSRPPGQLEISGSYRLADYHTEAEHRLLSTGQSMVVNDVRDGTRSPEQIAAFEAFDIAAIVNTPYLSNGRWVFDLGVTRSQPSVWREDEIELLREISARVWLRIERARAEEALRDSEAKYRSLFNSMDEGYFLCDVIFDENDKPIDILYLEANPAAIRLAGRDFSGQRMRRIDPHYEDYWYELYGGVALTGESVRAEHYAEPHGRWFDFYAFKVGGQENRRVAAVFRDVTDRKHHEQRQAYLLQLSDTLRSLSDAVEIHTVVTRIALNFFGADRCYYCEIVDGGAIIRRDAFREEMPSVAGVYPLSSFPIFKTVIDAGCPFVVQDAHKTDLLDESLRQLCCEMQVISFIDVPVIKEGKPAGVLCITQSTPRNWTALEMELAQETAERIWAAVERARAETYLRESEIQRVREQSALEQERQRAESLAELDRAKTLFFSNISHEFRTPLTLSLAPLQDALSDRAHPLDPIHRERLELVHRNNLRLLKLVNTLLDFSRIEAGRMEAVYEPTDLATFTTELASVFRSAIERAGLQLIVDCPPLPQPVYVDREMWEKIVLNLLSNAFKFTFEGEITVRLYPTDNQAILHIQDTGNGIAPQHLPHVFKRFYQIRGKQARTHEGSGIGLALVYELVQLHGGTIEVSSTLGEGTCFTIALPFGTDHLPSDRIHTTRTQASTAINAASYVGEVEQWLPTNRAEGKVASAEGKDLKEKARQKNPTPQSPSHVLVVDDNMDMREYLTHILSEHVHVEAATDGAAALAAVQKRLPDLIISDVMMPGLDGFGLLQALRSHPRTQGIPIILLSARAGEEAIVEGLAAGADDYLTKPFSAQELISRVTTHLQMAQLRGSALHEARTTIRHRDEFISIVSHELNTPLVSILGWTRLLRANPPAPAMLNTALDTIERNAMLQVKLVQDLLDISQITAGKLRLNTQPMELKAVIENAIATISQTAAEKGISLTWQEDVIDPVVVMGDSDRLSQVLINLLNNAIKFTPTGGQIKVQLMTSEISKLPKPLNSEEPQFWEIKGAEYAEIRVTDTGVGIPADFLPYVFDRFRQAEGTHSGKGLGLGLAIARHIVELHNGSIQAQSSGEAQGATFIVRLPLLQEPLI